MKRIKLKLNSIYEILNKEEKIKNELYNINEIKDYERRIRNPNVDSSFRQLQWLNKELVVREWVYSYILDNPGCLLLDAGCGWGEFSILFGLMGAKVIGVDFDNERLAFAEKRLNVLKEYASGSNLQLDLKFIKADIFDIMRLYTFDVIWAREAISHIHPIEVFFDIVYQNISEDGILAISDANWGNPKTKMDLILNYKKRWRPFTRWGEATIWWVYKYKDPETGKEYEMAMERVFSPWKLKRILNKSKLIVQKSKTIGFLPKTFITKLLPNTLRESVYNILFNIESKLSNIPIIRNFGTTNILIAKKSNY